MFKLILLVCAVMAATIAVSSAYVYPQVQVAQPLWGGYLHGAPWIGNIINPYSYGGVVGGYKGYGY